MQKTRQQNISLPNKETKFLNYSLMTKISAECEYYFNACK